MSRPVSRKRLGQIAALCLEGGLAMLENGAETSRVEETAFYLAAPYGVKVEAMATPTSITVTVGDEDTVTRVARVKKRSIDLARVAAVNSLTRELAARPVTLDQARQRVEDIRTRPPAVGRAGHFVAACLGSAAYTLLAGGGPSEALAGGVAGLGLKALLEALQPGFPPFLALSFASLLATLWGVLGGLGLELDTQKIVLGAIMPLMPGLALVTAARDLMAGELVSGVARGAEALLAASAIAVGVLVGLSLQRGWLA